MKHLSLRARLTFAYVALTAVSGTIMLGLIALLADRASPAAAGSAEALTDPAAPLAASASPLAELPPDRPVADLGSITYSSMIGSGLVALVTVMAVAAILGWLTARRALQPVRAITAVAQRAADHALHTRIRLVGPPDEIKELADAFDHMLSRLERSFTSQQRFLANAAHELKTPVATQRTLIEVAMAHPTAHDVPALNRRLLATLDHQQRLITGLLALAQDSGTVRRDELVDLGLLVRDALENRSTPTTARVELLLDLDPAEVHGDSALLAQLVHNLVANAILYNVPGGWMSARTSSDGTTSSLEISNSGPCVDDVLADQLFEPFRRLCFDRADPPPGNGLGLSVVRAIAEAHEGSATASPRSEGGLTVRVVLPAT